MAAGATVVREAPVAIASFDETTALGIAGLAAIGASLATRDDIAAANPVARTVGSHLAATERGRERDAWRAFVIRPGGIEG